MFGTRITTGLALLLFLPGYCLVAVLYPRRGDLENLERLGLAVGVSIAVTTLLVVFLNFLPRGISSSSVLASAISLTLLAALAAWLRLVNIPPEERFYHQVIAASQGGRQVSSTHVLMVLSLLLLLLGSFGFVANASTAGRLGKAFTQFYILGPTAEAAGYPGEIGRGRAVTVIIGVANYEHTDIRYRIDREVGTVTEHVATLQLSHGQIWEQPYTFILRDQGENRKITFLLYKEGEERPYRSLYLWVTVKGNPSGQ
ncbi:MAG TPA: DUF1616 domain-containing protein [Thermoflexia bacterium]|jgi:uncharacterized membrane protein|nr:DUF1616 domain-containing protein [Thermoflexia bacterium]